MEREPQRMQIITGIAGFKQLVRLAARCFYYGQVPPPDTTKSKRKEDQLALDLKVSPHVLRKTLRALEGEQFLRREHRKFKDVQKEKEAAEAGEEKRPLLAKTQSLCCIDYPRVVEILQLRIHMMRKKLKDDLEESDPVMTYKCAQCQKVYTSFDAVRLLSFADHKLHCEDCGADVEQALGSSGQTGDDDQRRARKAMLKKLQAKMELQLKPLINQLKEVKDAEPPDFGFHVDWTREQALKAIKRGNAANGGGSNKSGTGAGGNPLDTYWSDKTAVEVDMVSQEAADEQVKNEEAPAGKEMPAWMVTEADRLKAAEAAANAPQEPDSQENKAQLDEIHQEYVRQYMEAVAKRRQEVSALRAPGDDEPDKKRIKTEASVRAPVSEVKSEVKAEPVGAPLKEGIQWEEAAPTTDPNHEEALQWEDAAPATEPKADNDADGGDDDFEWEDAS